MKFSGKSNFGGVNPQTMTCCVGDQYLLKKCANPRSASRYLSHVITKTFNYPLPIRGLLSTKDIPMRNTNVLRSAISRIFPSASVIPVPSSQQTCTSCPSQHIIRFLSDICVYENILPSSPDQRQAEWSVPNLYNACIFQCETRGVFGHLA